VPDRRDRLQGKGMMKACCGVPDTDWAFIIAPELGACVANAKSSRLPTGGARLQFC
jgi:hypothetical protein